MSSPVSYWTPIESILYLFLVKEIAGSFHVRKAWQHYVRSYENDWVCGAFFFQMAKMEVIVPQGYIFLFLPLTPLLWL